MTFNRAKIMQDAWAVARRFAGNSETWGQRLSRALKVVWWNAKETARIAAEVEARRAALAVQFEGRSAASLRAEVAQLESAERLTHADRERLHEATLALCAALAREASAFEAPKPAEADDYAAKRALISGAGGRFCAVTFIKADGSRRVMRVQPATLKFHVKGDAAAESARKAVATRAERHPHLMPVWDAEAQAPRSVNLATVLSIRVDGATHSFAPAI